MSQQVEQEDIIPVSYDVTRIQNHPNNCTVLLFKSYQAQNDQPIESMRCDDVQNEYYCDITPCYDYNSLKRRRSTPYCNYPHLDAKTYDKNALYRCQRSRKACVSQTQGFDDTLEFICFTLVSLDGNVDKYDDFYKFRTLVTLLSCTSRGYSLLHDVNFWITIVSLWNFKSRPGNVRPFTIEKYAPRASIDKIRYLKTLKRSLIGHILQFKRCETVAKSNIRPYLNQNIVPLQFFTGNIDHLHVKGIITHLHETLCPPLMDSDEKLNDNVVIPNQMYLIRNALEEDAYGAVMIFPRDDFYNLKNATDKLFLYYHIVSCMDC